MTLVLVLVLMSKASHSLLHLGLCRTQLNKADIRLIRGDDGHESHCESVIHLPNLAHNQHQ